MVRDQSLVAPHDPREIANAGRIRLVQRDSDGEAGDVAQSTGAP
jgi:hypothetical protein